MTDTHYSRKMNVATKGLKILSIVVILLISVGASIYVSSEVLSARLERISTLASVLIKKPFLDNNLEEVKEHLETVSTICNLNGYELFDHDGTLLIKSGGNVEWQSRPEKFQEKSTVAFPFSSNVFYSKMLNQGKTSYGFLSIYAPYGAVELLIFVTFLFAGLAVFFGGFYLVLLYRSKKNDVTDSGQIDEHSTVAQYTELIGQRDEAILLAKKKGDFLANMSHEIRTSLNGIIGVLSLLGKSDLAGEKRRMLNTASRSADSLLLIIDDILDFSKIEAGKLTFEHIDFDLREVVEESISLFTDNALAREVYLHCYIPVDMKTSVKGDPTRLRQVLTNLLSNGIKFTERGKVSVSVVVVEQNATHQKLLFNVEDTGVGIEPDKVDSIFQMFTQADQATTRKYGGSGLGLSVCKNLIELQNGEIGVKSEVGQGTTFWFTLDVEIVEQQSRLDIWEIKDKTIVCFENCETCATILDQYLQGCTLHVFPAKNNQDVMKELQAFQLNGAPIDILMVDYSLINGELNEFIHHFISMYEHQSPDLYILTRNEIVADKLQRKGVAGVIYKPIRLLQLAGELEGREFELLGDRQKDIINNLKGNVLLVDDEPINLRVGEMILKRLGLDIEIAVNGDEAIQKTAAKGYDFVLMDIQMPEMSGIEATEIIRQRERREGVEEQVIIALTANALPSIRERCLKAGMQGFIAKPIKPEILYQHLQPWSRTGEEFDLAAPQSLPDSHREDITASDVVWDKSQALEFVGGDQSLLDDLMEMFLERKKRLLSQLQNSIESGSRNDINDFAHALKGAVNHFAAEKCRKLAQRIESDSEKESRVVLKELFTNLEEEVHLLAGELVSHVGSKVQSGDDIV